jgi:uncharacterized protein involved in exopolysaccharide biosynthesis
MEEYEVNLADYLRVLWRGKWTVVIITVAALAASIIFSLNLPSIYQARTQLMSMPTPALAEGVVPIEARLAPEALLRLANTSDLLREIGTAVYGHGEFTVEKLADRIQVTLEGTADFPILVMTVTGSDPQIVSDLANTWAKLYIERYSTSRLRRIVRTYEFIATSFTAVATDLSAAQERRRVFEQENPRELLVAELRTLLATHQRNLTSLAESRYQLVREEARTARSEEELAKIQPVITLQQGLDLQEIGDLLAGGLTEKELAALPKLIVEHEIKNELFFSIQRQIKEGRTTIAGLEAAISYVEQSNYLGVAQITALSAQLVENDLTIARLDSDVATLRAKYHDLSRSLLNARTAIAEEPEPITVVEAAIIPQVPIGPRRMLNVAIAGILGLMIGVFVAFTAHYLKDNHKAVENSIAN